MIFKKNPYNTLLNKMIVPNEFLQIIVVVTMTQITSTYIEDNKQTIQELTIASVFCDISFGNLK